MTALGGTSESSLSERLATVALERCVQLSPGTQAAAARSLFDFCGCIAGADSPVPSWPVDDAGRLAVCAHLRDQDDLHLSSVTHPGGIIWSVVTACAIDLRATWGEVIGAAVLGYEIVVRLAEALGSEHRSHWHVTTTAGVVGAAGAAAQLLGRGDRPVVDAIGHATSVASGSAQAQAERTGTRLLHRAFAASTGVACARAACAGLNGNRFGLEGKRGALVAGSSTFSDVLLGDRAVTALEETGFRLHPANGFAHAAIDAALILGPIDPERIAHLAITVSPRAGVIIASNPGPVSDEDAWWSIEHAVAICLATGSTDALASGVTDRVEVLRLCRDTTLVAADSGWSASVEVRLRDGQVRTATASAPVGHGLLSASDDDLCAKWGRLTRNDGTAFLKLLQSATQEEDFRSMLEAGIDALPVLPRAR